MMVTPITSKHPQKAFFAYARERHKIYLAKKLGQPRETWTKDPILSKYRFTNVYRELDAVTLWLKNNVRKRYDNSTDILLATVLFRMFNRVTTGEALFNQLTFQSGMSAFDTWRDGAGIDVLRSAIKSYGPPPYVTGAYIISSPPGFTKLDGVLNIVDDFKRGEWEYPGRDERMGWEDAALHIKRGRNMRIAYDFLRGIPWLGTFHSYEIVCDLRYTYLLNNATDRNGWANLGPGARRGLNRIFHTKECLEKLAAGGDPRKVWGANMASGMAYNDLMVKLLGLSRLPANWTVSKDSPAWELREVEHTLCEFDKYMRVARGEGEPRGVYR